MRNQRGKVVLILGLLLALVLSGSVATGLLASPPSIEDNDYTPDEILVKFKPGTPASVIAQVHRENKGAVKDEIGGIGVQVVKIKGDVLGKVKSYGPNPNVEYAEPNYIARALGEFPNDFHFGKQWGMNNDGQTGGTADADIDWLEAWNLTKEITLSSVKIAILDTGIDQDHGDLFNKIVDKEADQENFTNSETVNDLYGHGTHVAGIAAAIPDNSIGVVGVSYNSSLMNGKVLGDDGSGAYSWVANGIIWAANNGAKVINMSLGGTPKSKTVEEAVNYAWEKKVVLVAAAGNSNNPSPTHPAKYENCIAIAATDDDDAKASFSSYGDWVDVAAPGVDIFSTFPNHDYAIGKSLNYDYGSGTSMATPHVAGLAALLFAQDFGRSNADVRGIIETTADPISGTGQYWVHGRINACNAVGGNCPYEGGLEPTPTPTPEPIEPTPTPTECTPQGALCNCNGKCNPKESPGTCPWDCP